MHFSLKLPIRRLLLCSVCIAIIASGVLLWLLSLEGTIGLFIWDADSRNHFYLLGGCAVLSWIISLLLTGIVTPRALWFFYPLLLLCLALPVSYAIFVMAKIVPQLKEAPAVLFITDSQGEYSLPNLALSVRGSSPRAVHLTDGVNNATIAGELTEGTVIFPLRGLKPSTRYRWHFDDGTAGTFLTPALSEGKTTLICRFAVASDIHGSEDRSNKTATEKILRYIADEASVFNYFFFLGNAQHRGMENEQWQETLSTFSLISATVPLRPIMGNQEALIGGKRHYLTYCYPPGMETQRGSRLYYRIDIGNVRILMLHLLWDSRDFDAQQKAWLLRQLENISPDDWIFVLFHAPAYASGTNAKEYSAEGDSAGDNQKIIRDIVPILERFKVNAVFTGQNNFLEALQSNGIHYFLAGGMGGMIDRELNYTSEASLWQMREHGFIDVAVYPSVAEVVFRSATGEKLSSFVIKKRGDRS
ncbi:MAG: metallophosphoesterase [Deltaproteobacteria bacterium]|nr:metallophosphoesterase [Deltaproteobacteria bacterium]